MVGAECRWLIKIEARKNAKILISLARCSKHVDRASVRSALSKIILKSTFDNMFFYTGFFRIIINILSVIFINIYNEIYNFIINLKLFFLGKNLEKNYLT